MKNLAHLVTSFVVMASVVAFSEKPVLAQDAAKVAADACKVILENDQVRVLEFRVKPGQKVAMHSHPRRNYLLHYFCQDENYSRGWQSCGARD